MRWPSVRRPSGGPQGGNQERNALAQGDETDHHGDDHGEQTHDFIQNTGQTGSGNNAAQDGASNSLLKNPSFL